MPLRSQDVLLSLAPVDEQDSGWTIGVELVANGVSGIQPHAGRDGFVAVAEPSVDANPLGPGPALCKRPRMGLALGPDDDAEDLVEPGPPGMGLSGPVSLACREPSVRR